AERILPTPHRVDEGTRPRHREADQFTVDQTLEHQCLAALHQLERAIDVVPDHSAAAVRRLREDRVLHEQLAPRRVDNAPAMDVVGVVYAGGQVEYPVRLDGIGDAAAIGC